jgi:hypothetical protein
MDKREALEELKRLSLQLHQVEYEDIVKLLRRSIGMLPIPIGRLARSTDIDRVRKNDGEEYFSNVHEQLSYIRDKRVISERLTDFGRAKVHFFNIKELLLCMKPPTCYRIQKGL